MFHNTQLLISVRTNAYKDIDHRTPRLTMQEYRGLKEPMEASPATIAKRFDGWKAAKRLAGLPESA